MTFKMLSLVKDKEKNIGKNADKNLITSDCRNFLFCEIFYKHPMLILFHMIIGI